MSWNRPRIAAAIALGAAIAVAVTIITLNFLQPEKRIQQHIVHRYAIEDQQFRRELGLLLGPPLVDGNAALNLENGDEIFPSMLAAIREAQQSITFESYIYWSGNVGREFAEALAARASAGVNVHVLMDWVGSQKMDEQLLDMMRDAGVQVERYHPLRWYHLTRMNNRTHRKLLVVDGKVGFTGGVGIADLWSGHAQDPNHWRDSHYRVQGPVVAQMQTAFSDNWIKATGEVLQGERYFPTLSKSGQALAQVFMSSPSGGADSMMLMYLMAISSSTKRIDLAAAYFVPDSLTRRVMLDALKRGVEIRIIVPGEHIDTEVVRKASRAKWGELLANGAKMYEYAPTMFHCKTLIVDGLLVSVGSTNFDNRSFRLNDEANLNIYDAAFADKVTQVFEADLKRAKLVTYQMWVDRPMHEKIMENALAVFSSQL
ncbi:MAG TPA: phospholipase D-like domain-containing protein [Steroidobacteraceae bacterium]|nr:phospholipase D-like domain-containing protein [Steroidobacteraceae bacterium]